MTVHKAVICITHFVVEATIFPDRSSHENMQLQQSLK